MNLENDYTFLLVRRKIWPIYVKERNCHEVSTKGDNITDLR